MKYKVRYKIPGDGRYLELVVEAKSQSQARKVAQAQVPFAIIIGGPQPL